MCCSEKKASQGLLWRHLLSAVKGDVFVSFHFIEKDSERMIFIATLWPCLFVFLFQWWGWVWRSFTSWTSSYCYRYKVSLIFKLKGIFHPKIRKIWPFSVLSEVLLWTQTHSGAKSHSILVINETDLFFFCNIPYFLCQIWNITTKYYVVDKILISLKLQKSFLLAHFILTLPTFYLGPQHMN